MRLNGKMSIMRNSKLLAILLALAMVLTSMSSLPLTVSAADSPFAFLSEYDGERILTRGDLAAIDADILNSLPFAKFASFSSSDDTGMTQQEAVAFLLLYSGMKERQLGSYPDDYNAMALSVGLLENIDYDPDALCSILLFSDLLDNISILYDAMNADVKEPLFVNGMAQPIFDYDEVIRFCVYVETNYDTDGDGKLDLVKVLVQLPGDVLDGMEVASIFEARPYIAGTNGQQIPDGYEGTDGFDLQSLYAAPDPRISNGNSTTAEMAENANPDDWYYQYRNSWMYEDLDWYDYYLIRGFAVIESAGIGTMGSEGFSSCGADIEIDAFKCIIEWLAGNRAAYTDKSGNIEIAADWSNGNVGMTGRSYAGTTQFGLATTGVEGLKTIVPVAGIASWYEYTNSQGISTNTNVAYTQGLAWHCNSRYLEEGYDVIKESYGNYVGQLRRDQIDGNGDYNDHHWGVRDYTLDWEGISCPALIVHGVNDYNVKTKQTDLMYQAYVKAGQDVKLLLHQGAHMTPTYPSNRTEMYIDDLLYDEILNLWFSHYLYGVDNGIEDMAAVTAQNNLDGSWDYYDSWEAGNTLTINADLVSGQDETTISSNHAAIGVTSSNWRNAFTSGSTRSSAMYAVELAEDAVIKGAVAVNIKAAAGEDIEDTLVARSATSWADDTEPTDYDAMIPDGLEEAAFAYMEEIAADALGRDALMMSAMLVDIYEDGFMTYKTVNDSDSNQVSQNILKQGGAWMGGGLNNYDLAEFSQVDATYKIIARGWMDLYNPEAGYDSSSAANRTELEEGEFYDYTLYLQPNLYKVEEGHTLALVIYTWEPGRANYSQHYSITIDNTATYASIPVENDAEVIIPPTPVDKSDLLKAIALAESLNEDDYDPDLWADVEVALTEAREVYDDNAATQQQVNDATEKLLAAIDALRGPGEIEVESIKIDAAAITTMSKGETLRLSAIITPADAADDTVIWTSSTPTIATIDETGLVTAIKSGTARITATTSNGKTAAIAVRVTA